MKAAITLFTFLFIGSVLITADGLSKPYETQTFKGVVESVTLASDIMSGNISEITVVSDKGQKMTFAIRTGIGVSIAGSERLTSLTNVKNGDRVIIDYTMTKEGVKKVMAIECNKPRQK